MGGWYPVFFDQYDQEKLDQLLESLRQGRVASLSVQVDLNSELADQISRTLRQGCQCPVEIMTLHQPSTDTVQFARERVTVRVQTK